MECVLLLACVVAQLVGKAAVVEKVTVKIELFCWFESSRLTATVVFFYILPAVCTPSCQNGGLCVAPGQCSCSHGFEGNRCERRE